MFGNVSIPRRESKLAITFKDENQHIIEVNCDLETLRNADYSLYEFIDSYMHLGGHRYRLIIDARFNFNNVVSFLESLNN